ncbi:hypothetical protein BX616_001212 [Lobosporangium transversale]|uniref:C2H2-type domain-containing protein n=1 Tax=Lobosporangium transversale TaxID=64571 RepID=A0A1Y2GIX0_9FUNG|nr:hypothetical protein BCR41DRAFT_372554 [Lobosporangium transversale]KAF9904751.1 hypothetical protein BX616_001212 [Lobosporangium transversale]ORZ10376.1 hypothetical protein BCR41DRAFT_372554 [Lobosporangium transversale]|eukprot:XP_021879283.1 hypothetical protein BCR41DRAFT_372554 [Lobosporangium transversale]
MPATIPTPSINIASSSSNPHHHSTTNTNVSGTPTGVNSGSVSGSGSLTHGYPMHSSSLLASSPFSPEALAAATALRRPSLVLSVGSFHSAQLRRSSFFAPFPYGQSPQQFDALQDYSSSPRRGGGDVYQRDLEANYCTNFSCCGLNLGDLHALLQHYEECHVRFEEEDDNGHPVAPGFVDEEGWSTPSDPIPSSSHIHAQARSNHPIKGSSTLSANAAAAATVAALTASQQQQQKLSPLSFLNSKKKTNGVSLSDIYSEDPLNPIITTTAPDDTTAAFSNSILKSTAQAEFSSLASKKRDLAAYSTSFDTHSPMAKKTSTFQNMTLSSASTVFNNSNDNNKQSVAAESSTSNAATAASGVRSQEDLLNSVTDYLQLAVKQGLLPDCGEVGSASYMQAAEDLIRKREELVNIMENIGKSGSSSADKPYRCQVSGCDKAYKNPNGLKYHNQHGHCSAAGLGDSEGPESRPYVCTFMDCCKRYKNLNGLKYHIEHSHPNLPTALRAHQAGLTTHPLLINGVFANNQAAALAVAAALSQVESSPMMMAAINAITASANSASNNLNNNTSITGNRLSPSSDDTPDSSPNSSPALRPAAPTMPTSNVNATVSIPSVPSVAASANINNNIGQKMSINTNNLNVFRSGNNTFSTDVTPMASPVHSRATLPSLNVLSIQTGPGLNGMTTPSSLSPTSTVPKSPTGVTQVSTLTAALAAVTVEQQRQQQY